MALADIKDKVITSVATAAIIGGVAWFLAWNTTDDEVLPDVTALKQGAVELKEQTKAIGTAVDTFVANQAQQTMRINLKDIIVLEAKPREEWTPADKQLYETSKTQYADSVDKLSRHRLDR